MHWWTMQTSFTVSFIFQLSVLRFPTAVIPGLAAVSGYFIARNTSATIPYYVKVKIDPPFRQPHIEFFVIESLSQLAVA